MNSIDEKNAACDRYIDDTRGQLLLDCSIIVDYQQQVTGATRVKLKANNVDLVASDGYRMVRSDGTIIESNPDRYPINDEAKRETYRLASFKAYRGVLEPIRLTMAGFYYSGEIDRVICFSCRIVIESFVPGDNPAATAWHKKDCKFVLGLDSGNIALGAVAALPPRKLSVGTAIAPPPSSGVPSNEQDQFVTILVKVPDDHRRLLSSLNLYKEIDRRKSFTRSWSLLSDTAFTYALARQGFFYLGSGDRTQCFSCCSVLRRWQPVDNIEELHREANPRCRMLLLADERNIPVDGGPEDRLRLMEYSTKTLNLANKPTSTSRYSVETGRLTPSKIQLQMSVRASIPGPSGLQQQQHLGITSALPQRPIPSYFPPDEAPPAYSTVMTPETAYTAQRRSDRDVGVASSRSTQSSYVHNRGESHKSGAPYISSSGRSSSSGLEISKEGLATFLQQRKTDQQPGALSSATDKYKDVGVIKHLPPHAAGRGANAGEEPRLWLPVTKPSQSASYYEASAAMASTGATALGYSGKHFTEKAPRQHGPEKPEPVAKESSKTKREKASLAASQAANARKRAQKSPLPTAGGQLSTAETQSGARHTREPPPVTSRSEESAYRTEYPSAFRPYKRPDDAARSRGALSPSYSQAGPRDPSPNRRRGSYQYQHEPQQASEPHVLSSIASPPISPGSSRVSGAGARASSAAAQSAVRRKKEFPPRRAALVRDSSPHSAASSVSAEVSGRDEDDETVASFDPLHESPSLQTQDERESIDWEVNDFVMEPEKSLLREKHPCDESAFEDKVTFARRLNTFGPWFPQYDSKSTITDIAKAGFFSLGKKDHVCCFHCGQTTLSWSTVRDAWQQHAVISPNCPFLLRTRGPRYVEEVRNDRSLMDACDPESEDSEVEQTLAPFTRAAGPEYKNLLRTALSTQVVEQLLQLGYERETIKTLMKERVKNYARGYATINEALDDLLNMQPDLIDLGSMSSHSSSGSSIQIPFPSPVPEFDVHERTEPATAAGSGFPDEQEALATAHELRQARDEVQRLREERRCKVCLDRESEVVFLPCKHLCTCIDCARSLRRCPVCRAYIERYHRTYQS